MELQEQEEHTHTTWHGGNKKWGREGKGGGRVVYTFGDAVWVSGLPSPRPLPLPRRRRRPSARRCPSRRCRRRRPPPPPPPPLAAAPPPKLCAGIDPPFDMRKTRGAFLRVEQLIEQGANQTPLSKNQGNNPDS